MEGNESPQPLLKGQNTALKVEEVHKILNNAKEEEIATAAVKKPQDGDVYVYRPTADNEQPWDQETLQWKSAGTKQLIKNKKSQIMKQTYNLITEDGTVIKDCKREVYQKDNKSDGDLVLVHFLGEFTAHITEEDLTEGMSAESEPCKDQEDMETEETESVSADTTTAEPGPSNNTRMSSGRTPATSSTSGNSDPGPTAAAPDSSSIEPDLASAMKMMKAALAAKQGNKPAVMDVFNKLMESVVKTGDGEDDDVEYCLVVSNKKSGTSSIVGTPEIASTRRSSRKRTATQQPDDSDNEDEEPKKKKLAATKSPLKTKQNKAVSSEYQVTAWNGEVIEFPAPVKESYFSFTVVSNEEKTINADFFTQSRKSTKTEERYLKIRNHIINVWQQSKPWHVSKSQVRKGLTNCGDVTCISRIHDYLTCKGVINFQSERGSAPRVTPKRPKIVQESEDEEGLEDLEESGISDSDYSASEKIKPKRGRGRPRLKHSAGNKETDKSSSKSTSKTPARQSKSYQDKEKDAGSATAEEDGSETPVRSSGRSRRNVSTPNWADIMSGKRSFKKDGAILTKAIKTEIDDDEDDVEYAEGSEYVDEEQEDLEEIKCKKEISAPGKKSKVGRSSKSNFKQEHENNIKETKLDGTSSHSKEKSTDNKNADKDQASDAQEDNDTVVEDSNEQTDEAIQDAEYPSADARKKAKLFYKHACTKCSRTYASEFLLEQHMKVVHSENSTSDENNDKATQDDFGEGDDDDDYADDMQEESDKSMDMSDREYVPKSKKIHSKPKVVGGKPECDICGTQFLSFANLRKHRLLHTDKMYECPFCAKLMKRKDYVKSHVRKCHKDVDLEANPIDFDQFTHSLSEAEKKEAASNLNDTVGDEDADGETAADVKPKISKVHAVTGLGKKVCPECNKLYDTQADLEQHMILVHNKDLKDAAYTCQACKKQFKTLVSYQVHKLSHRKNNFVCMHCNKRFSTNSQLQVHKRQDHQIQYGTLMYFGFLLNNGQVTCEICSAEFDNMSGYLDHRTEHLTFEHLCKNCGNGFDHEEDLIKHNESNCEDQNLHLPCGLCDTKFFMYDTRRKHIMTNHPKNNENYCHHCAKSFDDIEQLRAHFSEHVKERVFICEICEKRFFEKRNLIDHRELHRSSKNFQCDICLRFYISSKSLQRHIKLHLMNNAKTCRHCGEKAANEDDLKRHLKQEHWAEEQQVQGRQSDGHQVACPKCSRVFPSNARLAKHMQLHPDDPSSSYLCVHCDKVFDSSKVPLWKHMMVEHPDVKATNGQKNFTCNICGFSTIHKQRLERHMETHNPDKEFVCKFCNKRYQTTSSLMTHMISHRGKVRKGAKPQPICTWPGCSKQFMKHSVYKRHLISHIFRVKVGKDLCECGKCPYSASQGKKYIMSGEVSVLNAVGFVDQDGNSHVVSHLKQKVAQDGSQSIVEVNVGAGFQEAENYQSMEVLHEAIAQIEDIEKGSGNNNKDDKTTDTIMIPSEVGSDQISEDTNINPDSVLSSGDVGYDNMMVPLSTNPEEAEQEISGETSQSDKDEETARDIVKLPVSLEASSTVEAGTQLADMDEECEDQSLPSLQNAQSGEHTVHTDDVALTGYECGVCELMFLHKCQVLCHLEEAHVDSRFPACEVCGKHMIDKKNLNDHKLIHEEVRRFACDVCDRRFRTKQCLKQHSYIHAEVKPFKCEHCGHGFTQRGFYEEHLRRHLGLRPYKCAMCNKGFVAKNMLKIHMYSHTGNRPYLCQYCPKKFSENYHLQSHIRNHLDNRPFQCTVCQKAFCVKPKLIRHMNTVHGIEKESLSNYYPTKIGKGIGYRDKTKSGLKTETRKTQVVYIDAHGNIVRQEMKSDEEIDSPKKIKTEAQAGKSTEEVQVEVVTHRDADGNIQTIVPSQFMPESLISLPEETEDSVVYQEILTENSNGENIELDGQNYTLVTTDGGEEEGHLQLITHALAGAQSTGSKEDSHIQVITQEVSNMEELGVEGADNIQVIEGVLPEGSQEGEVQKFSINIQEDGSLNAVDLETLRNLYSDQQIVIVLENQQQ